MRNFTKSLFTVLLMVLGLTLFHPLTAAAAAYSTDIHTGTTWNIQSSLYDFFEYYEEEDGSFLYFTPEESGRYVFNITGISSEDIDYLSIYNQNKDSSSECYIGDIGNDNAAIVFYADADQTQTFRIRPMTYDLYSFYGDLEEGEEPSISLSVSLRKIHDGAHTLKSKKTTEMVMPESTSGNTSTYFDVACQEEGCPYQVHMNVYTSSAAYTGKTVTKYPYEFSFSTSGDDHEWINLFGQYGYLTMYDGTHYTVKCSGKDVGTGTLTINIADELQSYIGKSFKVKTLIYPKKPAISSLTVGKKSLTVKAKTKVASTGGKYYQIAYRLNGKTKWTTVKTTKQSYTISKLTKGKKYQVRIRAYKKVDKTTYYSAWTKTQTSKAVK